MNKHSGWAVSLWGFIVANIPTCHELLVFVSIGVGVLQSVYLMIQIRRARRK